MFRQSLPRPTARSRGTHSRDASGEKGWPYGQSLLTGPKRGGLAMSPVPTSLVAGDAHISVGDALGEKGRPFVDNPHSLERKRKGWPNCGQSSPLLPTRLSPHCRCPRHFGHRPNLSIHKNSPRRCAWIGRRPNPLIHKNSPHRCPWIKSSLPLLSTGLPPAVSFDLQQLTIHVVGVVLGTRWIHVNFPGRAVQGACVLGV